MMRQPGSRIIGCLVTIAALGLLSLPPVALGVDDQDSGADWDNERLHSPLWQCVAERDQTREDLGACETRLGLCGDDLASSLAELRRTDDELQSCNDARDTCEERLAACETEENNVALLASTGQTKCYWENEPNENEPNTWVETNCDNLAAEGQDGEVRAGVAFPDPRFIDNNDGTVTDELTGKVWLKDWGCGSNMSWALALEFANKLKDGDCDLKDNSEPGDWHLPNRNELLSVVDISQFLPAVPHAQGNPVFTRVFGVYYSSSTVIDNPNLAWGINFISGTTTEAPKDSTFAAKAVAVRDDN